MEKRESHSQHIKYEYESMKTIETMRETKTMQQLRETKRDAKQNKRTNSNIATNVLQASWSLSPLSSSALIPICPDDHHPLPRYWFLDVSTMTCPHLCLVDVICIICIQPVTSF